MTRTGKVLKTPPLKGIACYEAGANATPSRTSAIRTWLEQRKGRRVIENTYMFLAESPPNLEEFQSSFEPLREGEAFFVVSGAGTLNMGFVANPAPTTDVEIKIGPEQSRKE